MLEDPIAKLLDGKCARNVAKYLATVALQTDEEASSAYFSWDGMYSCGKNKGRQCMSSAIWVKPDATSLLMGYSFAYRATASDPGATKGGIGGVAGVTSCALESIATANLIKKLVALGVTKIHVCVADGDADIHELLVAAFNCLIALCQNHSYKAIWALFAAWAPNDNTQASRGTVTSMGNSSAAVPPANLQRAKERLDVIMNALKTTGPATAVYVAPANTTTASVSAAAPTGSADSCTVPSNVFSGVSVAAGGEMEAAGGDEDEEEDVFEDGVVVDSSAADVVAQALASHADSERASEHAHCAMAVAGMEVHVDDAVAALRETIRAVTSARMTCVSASQSSLFAAVVHALSNSVSEAEVDDVAAVDDVGAAAASHDASAGLVADCTSASMSGGADSGMLDSNTPARVSCTCTATCCKRCPCKTANVKCSDMCACKNEKCKNRGGQGGLKNATAATDARARIQQGIFLPVQSYDQVNARLTAKETSAREIAARRAAARESATPAGAATGGTAPAAAVASAIAGGDDEASSSSDDDATALAAAVAEDDELKEAASSRRTKKAGSDTPAHWLSRQIKPRRIPEASGFGSRLIAWDYFCRAIANGDDAVYRDHLVKGLVHWFNDDPSCHRDCRKGCWLRKHYPREYGVPSVTAAADGSPADGASHDAVDVPFALRNIDALLAEFRVIRDVKFQEYIFAIVVILLDQFRASGGVVKCNDNHNEALNSKATSIAYANKRTYFSRYWQVS